MARPDLRIVCCLCGKPISRASDIYALDEEWQRRYPKMIGFLACSKCAVSKHSWSCRRPDGTHPAGHRPASRKDECYDSWDHIDGWGTHVAMVCSNPYSALLQGAEEYLHHVLRRPGVDTEVAQPIREAFARRAQATSSRPG